MKRKKLGQIKKRILLEDMKLDEVSMSDWNWDGSQHEERDRDFDLEEELMYNKSTISSRNTINKSPKFTFNDDDDGVPQTVVRNTRLTNKKENIRFKKYRINQMRERPDDIDKGKINTKENNLIIPNTENYNYAKPNKKVQQAISSFDYLKNKNYSEEANNN
jgi:hypothetical protein